MGQKVSMPEGAPEMHQMMHALVSMAQHHADEKGVRVGLLVDMTSNYAMIIKEEDFDKLEPEHKLVKIMVPVNPVLIADSHDGSREGHTREERKVK
ncbi:MAG: hypothetical protein GEU78_10405 [Actinobacteria bacterium]|nr:hypothetical protein [Actinomycetota bacterium]